MFEQATYTHKRDCLSHSQDSERAHAMYRSARDRGRRGQMWSMVTRTSRALLDLKSVEDNHEDLHCRGTGRRSVRISQIRGSEGRVGDFDRDFNPLKDYTRKRWLGIADARERGTALPPVSLVQVGDTYFVKDGHHRISVASAFGQEDIEARVVVWDVKGPLPWETEGRGLMSVGQARVGRRFCGGYSGN